MKVEVYENTGDNDRPAYKARVKFVDGSYRVEYGRSAREAKTAILNYIDKNFPDQITGTWKLYEEVDL